MAKANEIAYIEEVVRINRVPLSEFQTYLLNKPFSDPRCHEHLTDVAQIMSLLPPAPAKVLDVGVGSGWTSELFARAGHEVTGIDISPDMIAIAKLRNCNARFLVSDYEDRAISGKFDAAVIYDALHHADDEQRVVKNIYDCLSDNAVRITAEPGEGHSRSPDSLQAVKNYGTTEKDMPFKYQRAMMMEAGFKTAEQYVRVSQMTFNPFTSLIGSIFQIRSAVRLARLSAAGFTSIVVARK
jgi:2-polyprenyl-3-methyl-5-hydroxy-6-metoxy-1,4-benzoquinol methylase